MLLCVLFAMSAGFEAGVNQPLLGFQDLTAGAVAGFRLEKTAGLVDLGLGFQATFYQGKNQAYSQHHFGFRFLAAKNQWLCAPVIEAGADYLRRQMDQGGETGFSFNYLVGVRLNFRYQLLTVYPLIHYEGCTDFRSHCGFIGVKLGIKHEL